MRRPRSLGPTARPVGALLLSVAFVVALVTMNGGTREAAPAPGPFVTFLFSRTEITGAVDCVPNSTGVARLDTAVAPYLRSLHIAATGSLQTAGTGATARNCTHYRSTIMGSWADATMLSSTYGWSFVSHTATYPTDLRALSPQQQWDETCGSARAIDRHGLHGGHGLIAYPGAGTSPALLHETFGQHCFAWGRHYDETATTAASAASTPPYWQETGAFNGGPCNVRTAACYSRPLASGHRYSLPSALVARVTALAPGSWATLQSFVLVAGAGQAGTIRWDCTASNPALHWTNDNERYCYKDFQAVARAVHARADITVTDPLTVGVAWGRPATYGFPRPIG